MIDYRQSDKTNDLNHLIQLYFIYHNDAITSKEIQKN